MLKEIRMVSALLFSVCALGQPQEIVAVACLEHGMFPDPCRIYHIEVQGGMMEKKAVVDPQGGIRAVKLSPEEHKLAVWHYARETPASSTEVTGDVEIVDLYDPSHRIEIPLPYEPVLGGFFCMLPGNDVGVVTDGGRGRVAAVVLKSAGPSDAERMVVVASCRGGEAHEVNPKAFAWGALLLHGGNFWGANRRQGIPVRIDPETGAVARVLGYEVWKTDFSLSTEALEHFNTATDHGRLIYKNNPLPDNAEMSINNRKHTVVCVNVKRGESVVSEREWAIFDKSTGTWKWFSVPYPEDKRAAYRSVQQSGEWLVFQDILKEPTVTTEDTYVPEARWTFYDFKGESHGSWDAKSNTELLFIEKESLVFRRDNALYWATFKDGAVGDEHFIVRDDALKQAHWAVPVEKDKGGATPPS